MYQGCENGTLVASKEIISPNLVNINDFVKNSTNYYDYITYINPFNANISEFQFLPLFFIFFTNFAIDQSNQLGIIFDNGLEFRYPSFDLEYIDSCFPCKDSKIYDPRCLFVYYDDSALISDNLALYYQYNMTLMIKSLKHSLVYYFPDDYFQINDPGDERHKFLIVKKNANHIYGNNNSSFCDSFNENLTSLLSKEGFEITNPVNKILIPGLSGNESFFDLVSFNSEYLSSFSYIYTDQTNYTDSLIALILINKFLALKDYNNFLDYLYNLTIGQILIFFTFFCVGNYLALKLSGLIKNRVIKPLILIENHLNGGIPKLPRLNFNLEVNEINKYLLYLEIVEQVLDPRFLLHPNSEIRLENLKELESLFESMKNNKGLAITKNLIGNIYFADKDYDKAIDLYRESLSEMESLFNEVIAQEHAETKLTYEEKKILVSETGKKSQG